MTRAEAIEREERVIWALLNSQDKEAARMAFAAFREQQGKMQPAADVVDLPCKVGDIVWTLKRAWRKEDGVAPFQITNLTITQNKKGVWTKKYRAMILVDGKTRDWSHDFAFDEIGKTTFFTKEDAEKALLCGAKMDGGAGDAEKEPTVPT